MNVIELVTFIQRCIDEDKMWKFYKTREWLALRREVLEDNHGECYLCRKNGKITKAVTVHHIYEVKDYPQYALSRYVVIDGKQEVNLIPLCARCHNKEHDRFDGSVKKKSQPINDERW